jgi:hypothetical protein
MERQRNFLQYVVSDKKLLPIEEEFLLSVKDRIENVTGLSIDHVYKQYSNPLYDCFLATANQRSFYLKVNLSPDLPNSWDWLSKKDFDLHPKVLCSSSPELEFKFIFFEIPKGILAEDISNSILSPRLNLTKIFTSCINRMHSTKIGENDNTKKIYESFLPPESIRIYSKYPVVDLFSTLKFAFDNIYKSNLDHCGLCHFDLSPENIIYTGSDFKFINFEYSAHANKYLDIWLAKSLLNCSDQTFSYFLQGLDQKEVENIMSYKPASYYFNFAYFNSKIIAEYMTFGLRDPVKLRYWIKQSSIFYPKISSKLYVEKAVDKSINDFYYLWIK